MNLTAPGEEIVCDAVWPSAANESAYYHALAAPIADMDTQLRLLLTEAWRQGTNTIGLATDAPSSLTDILRKRLDAFAEHWTDRWAHMERRIANDFASGSARATDAGVLASFRKAGFTIKFQATKGMRDAYATVVEYNVGLIRSIPQQYLKDVQSKVWDSVMQGSDLNKLTVALTDTYGIASRRAAFIAIDQNNKAKATFEEQRRSEVGITEAEWQHSAAGVEPRNTHVKAGQQRMRYKIKDGWIDPHDGEVCWPGTKPRCRCSSRAIIPGLTRRKF